MEPSELVAGAMLPGTKYQVIRRLGEGAMGIVFHVVKAPDIHGVLKMMAPQLARNEAFRSRFLEEARVLAQLEHPNIVRVFDYDSLVDGTPYFVMELLSGETLRERIEREGPLPAADAVSVARQVLEALSAAHGQTPPVVHRDVKPENIFLHRPRHGAPVVKLIDFGVMAHVVDGAHDRTFMGTIDYASPEQLMGEPPSTKSDVYSAAIVLFESLTGRCPFDHHAAPTAVHQAHVYEPPPRLASLRGDVPPALDELVESALAKAPGRRPASARAFAAALADLELEMRSGDTVVLPTRPFASVAPMATPVPAPRHWLADDSTWLDRSWPHVIAASVVFMLVVGVYVLSQLAASRAAASTASAAVKAAPAEPLPAPVDLPPAAESAPAAHAAPARGGVHQGPRPKAAPRASAEAPAPSAEPPLDTKPAHEPPAAATTPTTPSETPAPQSSSEAPAIPPPALEHLPPVAPSPAAGAGDAR